MKPKNSGKLLLILIAIGLSLLFITFIASGLMIGAEVESVCRVAKQEYETDGSASPRCVDALIMLVGDENKSYRMRNSAVWALGQLGDKSALPVLRQYYTDNIPAKESLEKSISQYELKKAIKLVNGGPNITAFIWRNSIFGSEVL